MAIHSASISKAARATVELGEAFTGEFEGAFTVLSTVENEVNSTALTILNGVSCLSALTGPLLIAEGMKMAEVGRTFSDLKGQILGILEAVRGAIQTVGGLCMIPSTVLTVAYYFTAIAVMAAAAVIFTEVGGVILSLATLVGGAYAALDFTEALRLYRGLKAGSEEKLLEQIKTEIQDPTKRAIAERRIERDLLEKILKAAASEAKALIDELRTTQLKALAEDAICVVLSLLAFAFTVVSLVVIGEVASFALGIAGTIMGVLWLIYDLHRFVDDMRAESGVYDKIWLALNAAFFVLIIAASIALSANPLVTGVILSVAIIVLLIYAVCVLRPKIPLLNSL